MLPHKPLVRLVESDVPTLSLKNTFLVHHTKIWDEEYQKNWCHKLRRFVSRNNYSNTDYFKDSINSPNKLFIPFYKLKGRCGCVWLRGGRIKTCWKDVKDLIKRNYLLFFFSQPMCDNHDDGETAAIILCNVCGNLCTDCDRFLHLHRRTKTHQRQVEYTWPCVVCMAPCCVHCIIVCSSPNKI